jgi:porphobilinogen deaminase
VLQHAAREEISELLLHELWQSVAIAVLRRCIQERLQMLADHAIQHAVLGGAGLIRGKVGHADDVDATSGR